MINTSDRVTVSEGSACTLLLLDGRVVGTLVDDMIAITNKRPLDSYDLQALAAFLRDRAEARS